MSDINSESLKQLAEYMGYKIAPATGGTDGIEIYGHDGGVFEYDPLNNAEQDRELEIEFEMDTSFIRKDLHQAIVGLDFGMTGGIDGRGKTPSEARLNAAIAAAKDL